jgi:hypothetical protein
MSKRAVEKTGLIPRSIIRTFERFQKQLLPGAEMLVIQEFRISRYQVIVSVRCLLTLLFVPLLVNMFSKTFLINPVVQYVWNQNQTEIFLNTYQQNRALLELHAFEEKIYFESLLNAKLNNEIEINFNSVVRTIPNVSVPNGTFGSGNGTRMFRNGNGTTSDFLIKKETLNETNKLIQTSINHELQQKTYQIARRYNSESIEAISNFFADFLSLFSLALVFILMKPQIIILKSFLAESLYSLSDTTKSFLLILGTDLLVGFHSPRGWEVFLEWLLRHFGLPENSEFMSLFVATFPVFLDTVFKYWIFRSLNKISPSTVATYHNMIE